MRKISEQELKDILDKHDKWLKSEDGGEKANLSNCDLSFADLSYADLRSANLSFSDLMIFQMQRHQAFYTFDGTLRIGCEVMPITEWALGFKQIGRANGYTDEQIEAYGDFIMMCLKHFKRG
ncbi:MAG: pentapeptide repeat-containing protein [Pseudobdellovibrionaceae bacterium]